MVKIVNIMKAASVWVAAIFMLYGNRDVESTARRTGRFQGALAVSRSPEGGAKGVKVYGGKEFHKARDFRDPPQMSLNSEHRVCQLWGFNDQ